ncbi:MAG TPA: efflux RND transporter periplasmic adaptor subunit [Hyphomicrobiaceae bacterium]|nr:efflux RND transporter periplasmic adaptor subunit [Hyphomicrobiaceae bacterium]
MHYRRPSLAWLFLVTSALAPVSAAAQDAKKTAAAELPSVLVAKARAREMGKQSEFVGRVQAFEKVELRARVSGFLRERKFDAGAKVTKGDILYLIEPEPFEAALAQRRAQLVSAEATHENAVAALKRYRDLESKQVASTAQLDEKIADEKRATASIAEAKAAIQDAEINLSYTKIVAPISGTIGRSSVDPGNLVGPDSGVLATLVRTDQMYALFPVTQRQLLEAKKSGSKSKDLIVRARLADGSLAEQKGVIDFLDVTVDPRTDGQIVRALFPNNNGLLTDGQTLRLLIESDNPQMATVIPMAALATDQGGTYVFVVGDDNKVVRRNLKLGISRDGVVSVTDGLKLGERVIVQGQQKVREGATVNAELEKEPADDQGGSK